MPPKYQVICLDGETRHSAPFATLSAAVRWTAQGHDCAPATVHDLVVCGSWNKELDKIHNENAGVSRFDTVEFRISEAGRSNRRPSVV